MARGLTRGHKEPLAPLVTGDADEYVAGVEGCSAIPGTARLRVDVALLEPGEARRQDLPREAPFLLPRQGVKGLRKRGVEGWEGARHDAAAGTSFS